jgi:hypothetical protein
MKVEIGNEASSFSGNTEMGFSLQCARVKIIRYAVRILEIILKTNHIELSFPNVLPRSCFSGHINR